MQYGSRSKRLGAVIMAVATLSAGPLFAAEFATQTEQVVELREIGRLKVTARFYGEEAQRSSWVTMKATDAQKAETCASKYLEDLLGFGDVTNVSSPELPGTHLALAGTGQWLLGLDGKEFQVLFARNADDLARRLKTANAAQWHAVPRGAYPRWLDVFDNAAMTFWFSGFGILPKDLPADLKWHADNGFTACFVTANTEGRLVAPGVLDSSAMDWQSAVAREYNIPYKTMTHMAQPNRPECLWNYAPLPYVIPADGQHAAASLDYQKLAVHAPFQPVAATDRYMMDFRRRVAEHLKDDPNFVGYHVMQEMPSGDSRDILALASVAGSPAIQEFWRNYLRDVLTFDLKTVGQRHRGDASAFRSWAEVPIPALKELAGWDASVIDLTGEWEGRADRQKVAETGKWFEDGNASDQWRPVDCQDLGIMLYGGNNSCDYWLRKKFTVTSANSSARFFHMARHGYADGALTYDLWVNGKKVKMISGADPSSPDWDMCYDAGDALKPGENLIVLNTKGVPVSSYAFIGGKGLWVYPGPSELLNARFFDMVRFGEWLAMRELENRMIGIRAGESNRPMKIMAPHNYIEPVLELCARYGAYPHDTGGAGAWFGPFTYSRYAFTRGIPNSVEEGGIPANAAEMQACMTRYLMMGADTVDNVGHRTAYTENAGINAWIAENRELLRCFGKLALMPPAVGILRSGRELRLGISDIYGWDMGRGPLPAIGRPFNYATLGDVKNGRANQFRVLLDCGTNVMSEEEVDTLERYVREGGIFVAFHNTGMHTPEKRYAWPISRLTGLRVLNDNRPIGGSNIRFSDKQTLWPKLRGQEVPGWGLVLDWQKQDRTGTPIVLAAADKDIEVIAEWKNVKMDGNIAVAIRTLGKGKVVTLGSTFYRSGKDDGGRYDEPGTLPYLDELLAALGAPRATNGGGLWVEPWRSKNGLYDVYPVAQMDPKAAAGSFDVKIRRSAPASTVWELSALKHPDQPARYADGWLTIPGVKMEAMQSRVYALPRQDLENSTLDWLAVQARQWRPVEKIPTREVKRATVEPATDVIPLIDGWRCATGERDQAWIAPGDASAKAWKIVRLGAFASLGLPEDTLAQFRREVKLPAAWAGQRVTLFFNAEHWFWGIGLKGRLWINGEAAAVKQPLQPQPDGGCLAIELTPEQTRQQPLVIALEVDGRQQEKNRPKPRPSGVTGTFFLRVSPQPVQTQPLTPWSCATDLNALAPASVGQKVECLYLETTFVLPAQWPAKRLYLKSPVAVGAVFINNQYVAVPAWMHELDVSGLVRRKGENVLRWVPGNQIPSWRAPYKGTVPELSLMWSDCLK